MIDSYCAVAVTICGRAIGDHMFADFSGSCEMVENLVLGMVDQSRL